MQRVLQMSEEINKALQDKDWAKASELLKAELEKEPEDEKLLHDLLYNLIACSINLKRFRYAKNLIEKNINLFSEEEAKGMIRELRRTPNMNKSVKKQKAKEVKEQAAEAQPKKRSIFAIIIGVLKKNRERNAGRDAKA